MTVLTVNANWSCHAQYDANQGTYTWYVDCPAVCRLIQFGQMTTKIYAHGAYRWSLADLPSGASVSQVRFRGNVTEAGGSSHLGEINAYNSTGQPDPALDSAYDFYYRCFWDPHYLETNAFRTTGWTPWLTLGSSICTDIQNAKTAVNRFSLGFTEHGDNDPWAALDSVLANPGQLEITYTVPEVAGYSYNDGLVSVFCALKNCMRDAILSVCGKGIMKSCGLVCVQVA